ncbi:MAG TPA: NAD(P)H-hydrate epimerase, partial [Pyrinomonadaceae bacterium]|nr:NAD(P)H-hydrate epimerase [Pyrinomonadaceae bacterium]
MTGLFIFSEFYGKVICMRKVISAAEMREVDRLTTEKYGIPQILLMENAAQAAASAIKQKLGGTLADSSILVLCGKGNNGGDGAALARILWQQGADVEVCLFGLVADTKDEARVNFEILQKIADGEHFEVSQPDLAFEEITSVEEWLEYDALSFHSDDPDVIVDALFGTGLSRPLDGVFQQVAAFIGAFQDDDSDGPMVVSLDMPSGLDSDKAEPIGVHAKVDLTVTFTAAKPANVLPPASNSNGELFIANIGSPCELIEASSSQLFIAERSDAVDWLRATRFKPNSYKNSRGHAMLITGSPDYSGAAVLCGNAAMRTGVGLVTIVTAERGAEAIVSRISPEVIVRRVSNAGAFDDIAPMFDTVDAIAIGPGLHVGEGTAGFVRQVLERASKPVIVDADALNCISPWDVFGTSDQPFILTPHEGEFKRIAGSDRAAKIGDRVSAARNFAANHNVIL